MNARITRTLTLAPEVLVIMVSVFAALKICKNTVSAAIFESIFLFIFYCGCICWATARQKTSLVTTGEEAVKEFAKAYIKENRKLERRLIFLCLLFPVVGAGLVWLAINLLGFFEFLFIVAVILLMIWVIDSVFYAKR